MSDLILFDIDGVLFNPQKFGSLIRAEFIKILNIEEEDLIRANADYYSRLEDTTDFNPREITAFIAARFGKDQKILDPVFWENEEIYKKSIFEDAEDTLKSFSKNKTLGIFSQGFEELQLRKLAAGGIKKYFQEDKIYIRQRKLSDEAIALLPRDATVIDNRHDVVKSLAPFVDVIWLNRKSEDVDPGIRTIHSLRKLLATSG